MHVFLVLLVAAAVLRTAADDVSSDPQQNQTSTPTMHELALSGFDVVLHRLRAGDYVDIQTALALDCGAPDPDVLLALCSSDTGSWTGAVRLDDPVRCLATLADTAWWTGGSASLRRLLPDRPTPVYMDMTVYVFWFVTLLNLFQLASFVWRAGKRVLQGRCAFAFSVCCWDTSVSGAPPCCCGNRPVRAYTHVGTGARDMDSVAA